MLVFNGGLTIEQVEKLKNGYPIIYDKVPYKQAFANRNNTFNYVPDELINSPLHVFRKYISEDCYHNQYIFLARYLYAVLEFCNNSDKKNYIMVCDIDENILNNYIGVGNYLDGDYRIEYRLPRNFITPDTIKEFFFFEPFDRSQMNNFYEKYKEYYYVDDNESYKANKLILQKKLKFNSEKF